MKNKQAIYDKLSESAAKREALAANLRDKVSLDAYAGLMYVSDGREIWSEALQKAVAEHEITVIPPRAEPYYIDRTIIVPSNRRIEAAGAIVRLTPGCDVLMLRNSSTANGTYAPIRTKTRDCNISVCGGRWEESRLRRGGYGSSGKYDSEYSFHGVSTLFFFNNMDNLTLSDVTFAHTAGFAVQVGDIRDVSFSSIRFDSCYADGLHINGNTENLICRDIAGEVGDDLVALNAYDWQNSSVDFGPITTVLCDGLELSESSRYKALRIEPGRYYYRSDNTVVDGSIDCALIDAVIKNVRGIRTFKMYYQTPRYRLGTSPESGGVGSVDNVFFEDIDIDLCGPIDNLAPYAESDPVRGSFAAFELGSDIGYMSLENIHLTLYRDKYPYSYLVCCGPKSVLTDNVEIFDPYLSSRVETLELSHIYINGVRQTEIGGLAREIAFDNIDGDGNSTARGEIGKIIFDGRENNKKRS